MKSTCFEKKKKKKGCCIKDTFQIPRFSKMFDVVHRILCVNLKPSPLNTVHYRYSNNMQDG